MFLAGAALVSARPPLAADIFYWFYLFLGNLKSGLTLNALAQGFGGLLGRIAWIARMVQIPDFCVVPIVCSYCAPSLSVGPCGPLIDLKCSLVLREPLGAQCSLKAFELLKFLGSPRETLREPWGALGTLGNFGFVC